MKKNFSHFLIVLLLFFCLGAEIYLFGFREYNNFHKYFKVVLNPTLATAFLLVSSAFLWTIMYGKEDRNVCVALVVAFIILIIFLSIFFAIHLLAYSVFIFIYDSYLWLSSSKISRSSAILITLWITFLIGLSLFYFRLKMRAIYGTTEVIVGMAVAAHQLPKKVIVYSDQELGFYLAILTAGIYLVVRGLDNIHQGFTKDPKDIFSIDAIRSIKKLLR